MFLKSLFLLLFRNFCLAHTLFDCFYK
uniref:Uncharacterized protein n=1 Tax=Arundo donax TaxID=35708 RepID=A0A0A9BB35_ARUDO